MVRARPAAEDPAIPEAFSDRTTNDAPNARLRDALPGAPDIAHGVGADESDIVEERSGENEVDPARGAVSGDHPHPRRGDEPQGRIGQAAAGGTKAADFLDGIRFDAQDRS